MSHSTAFSGRELHWTTSVYASDRQDEGASTPCDRLVSDGEQANWAIASSHVRATASVVLQMQGEDGLTHADPYYMVIPQMSPPEDQWDWADDQSPARRDMSRSFSHSLNRESPTEPVQQTSTGVQTCLPGSRYPELLRQGSREISITDSPEPQGTSNSSRPAAGAPQYPVPAMSHVHARIDTSETSTNKLMFWYDYALRVRWEGVKDGPKFQGWHLLGGV